MKMKKTDQVSRRDFFKQAGVLAGAVAVAGAGAGRAEAAGPIGGITLRRLGKTELKVPVISLGSGPGQEVNVMKYAISQGLNFIHTSVGYKKGQAIKNVAQAIKGQREKVIVGLKITWQPDDDAAMDAALAELGVDSVDIAFFNIHKADEVRNPAYRRGAEHWIKQGKFKYIGLTSHKETAGCMKAALEQGFYDVLMPSYNLTMEEEFLPIFKEAQKQDVGIVLMKTKKGIAGDTYYDSIPQYLATAGVCTISKGVTSFQEIKAIVEASQRSDDAATAHRVREAARVAMAGHCTMCGACEKECPQGLPVADVVRCSDYYMEHPEYVGTAFETYGELVSRPMTAVCGDCTRCEQACSNGVPIVHHIRRAENILA
jgi:predicted aldo/keto reductase-like oxidoreductase